MAEPPSPYDFHVAIICALSIEHDAVEDIFDRFWEDEERAPVMIQKAPNDTNVYTTGKIGQHNVVVAHMANYGISSSAGVAANLRHTFPAVRVAFIVGVCGGVPKNKSDNIFLGDVIISTGIVEYGLGRQRTHELQPINPLGRAHQHEELQAYLEQMMGRRGTLLLQKRTVQYLADPSPTPEQTKPQYPGIDRDNLFVSTHPHKHHKHGECGQCDKCLDDNDIPCEDSEILDCAKLGCHQLARERKNPATRESTAAIDRSMTKPEPRVHFGRIGTADSVMKSGTRRDELAGKYDLIAFEMEGAGAWTKLPCFIIKGVCDYSDSHKSKEWQPYAAATAAACLKAFLDTWRGVASRRDTVVMPSTSDSETLEFVRNLFVVDPQVIRNELEREKGSLLSNTGWWIFKPPPADMEALQSAYGAFNQWWTNDQSQVLWIRGDPGKGKTMLAMSLIDELRRRLTMLKQRTEKHVLAYCFCVHSDDRMSNATYAVRSLLWQILSECPEVALRLHQKYTKQRGEVLLSASSRALQSLLNVFDESLDGTGLHAYIVIDALDECSEESRDVLLKYLKRLDTITPRRRNIKWLITIRNDVELWHSVLAVSLEECRQNVDKAVEQYIDDRVHNLALDKDYGAKLRVRVETTLRDKANGTFLWVSLACKELAKPKVKAMNTMEVLLELPSGLMELYRRMLDQVLDNDDSPKLVAYAISIIQTVLVADHPLTLKELSIAANLPEKYWGEERSVQDCVSLCGSFLNIRKETGHVTLVHQSAKDYLAPKHCMKPKDCRIMKMYCRQPEMCLCSRRCLKPTMYPDPAQYPGLPFPAEESKMHSMLAKTCVEYLAGKVFPQVFEASRPDGSRQPVLLNSDFRRFPLATYALMYWVIHGRGASPDLRETLKNIALKDSFLQKWIQGSTKLGGHNNLKIGIDDNPESVTFHIGCYTGIQQLIEVMLEQGAAVNELDDCGRTGLSYAVENGYEAVVDFLVKRKAAVNAQDIYGYTPLLTAVAHQQDGIVRILIEAGAEVNIKNNFGTTPLHQAIDYRNDKIAELLIDSGAIISALDKYGRTPLHLAAGGETWGRHLIQGNGFRAYVGLSFGRAFGREQAAKDRSSLGVVELLLKHHADVSAPDTYGCTPLHWAAYENYIVIVNALLSQFHANVNVTDNNGWTPLHWVADKDLVDTALQLFMHGANPDIQDKFGRTALHWAAMAGNIKMTKLLLEKGAKPNILDNFSGATALHCAVQTNKDVCLLLLEYGANPNAQPETTRDPLGFGLYTHERIEAGDRVRYEVVESKAADKLRSKCTAGIPLFWANDEITKLLLDHGVDLDATEKRLDLYPLAFAARFRRPKMVEELLKKGADPNVKDISGRTALLHTGDTGVVELLLSHGADVNATTASKVTALHLAAWFWEDELVALLLRRGANPNAKDKDKMTPFQRAKKRMTDCEREWKRSLVGLDFWSAQIQEQSISRMRAEKRLRFKQFKERFEKSITKTST